MKATLTYFKPNGKWYINEEVDLRANEFYAAAHEVEAMIASGEAMPGLSGPWDGPVMMTIDDLPHLFPHPAPRGRATVAEAADLLTRLDVVSVEQEEDGKWIGEIKALPGCLVYARNQRDAKWKAVRLAVNILVNENQFQKEDEDE